MPLSEEKIIQKYFSPLSEGDKAACGLNDDTALLSAAPGNAQRLITTDMAIAGVHFFENDQPGDIARKVLGVNVSDIVASGGRPEYYLLSIALNDQTDESWVCAFADGLLSAQKTFGLRLIGGDTTRGRGPLTISITALGTVAAKHHTTRAGAKPGDEVFVSGTIGDSFLGCALLGEMNRQHAASGSGASAGASLLRTKWAVTDEDFDFLTMRYLHPQPRTELIDIIGLFASAAMDVSDGLMLDFSRLAKASKCGGDLEVASVPLSAAARRITAADHQVLEKLLTGGDDYELLFTVPSGQIKSFYGAIKSIKCPVSHIGTCTDKSGACNWRLACGDDFRAKRAGYDHFSPK